MKLTFLIGTVIVGIAAIVVCTTIFLPAHSDELINSLTIIVALISIIVSAHLAQKTLQAQLASSERALKKQTELHLLDKRLPLIAQARKDYLQALRMTPPEQGHFATHPEENYIERFTLKYPYADLLFDPRTNNYLAQAQKALRTLWNEANSPSERYYGDEFTPSFAAARKRYLSALANAHHYMVEELDLKLPRLDDILFPQEAGVHPVRAKE